MQSPEPNLSTPLALCAWIELTTRRRQRRPRGLFYRRCPRQAQGPLGLCAKHARAVADRDRRRARLAADPA
ncbi:MAG: hypothetical protein AB7N76_04040 [Planctomycetota bacterium]